MVLLIDQQLYDPDGWQIVYLPESFSPREDKLKFAIQRDHKLLIYEF